MSPAEIAALDAVRAVYGASVLYTGGGLPAVPVVAVRSDRPADPYQGFSGKGISVTFEIAYAALAAPPRKGDRIDADRAWTVIDVDSRDDIQAHILTVEA